MDRALERRIGSLRECGEKLGLVNPFAILARGYAVAYREGTKSPLLSAASVRPGERIRVRLHEGELRAIIRGTPLPRPPRPMEDDFGPLFSDAAEDKP
jgi:exonuclease VII large subunit